MKMSTQVFHTPGGPIVGCFIELLQTGHKE